MVEYVYDAWGTITPNGVYDVSGLNLAELNPFRYRGYYYDTETGLYYLKTRYYDPAIGRFMTIDGIEYLDPETINGLNLYAYCNNNPVMNIDPNGNLPRSLEIVISSVGYTVDLYAFGLKMVLKHSPKISMIIAREITKQTAGFTQYIRATLSSVAKNQQKITTAKKFSKYWGRAALSIDILWNIGENIHSGSKSWVTDSIVDIGMSIGIYALGLVPYVGWLLAIGAVVLTGLFEDKIEHLKKWVADSTGKVKDFLVNIWNDFWEFSWI